MKDAPNQDTDFSSMNSQMTGVPARIAKRLYNIQEAAIYLGRTTWAVRGMIAAGKIPYVRDGRRILLDIRDMDVWIERSKAQVID